MWLKWFPWKFILKRVARAKGFVDPILLLSKFNRFAQPSEVWAPVELMRAGAVLHARGLLNSQVIQHNLDWVWPYWAERQFDPQDQSFVPRAFSVTQINLTHRNWTATGIPGYEEMPVVDPAGLVMPFYDSWSIDGWVVTHDGDQLIPSRLQNLDQSITTKDSVVITTEAQHDSIHYRSRVETVLQNGIPACRIDFSGVAPTEGYLVVALRPYNPEGVSFIHEISLLHAGDGWKVDRKHFVFFTCKPDMYRFSNYHNGDVYHWVLSSSAPKATKVTCDVGMATALAAYRIEPGRQSTVTIHIPLEPGKNLKKPLFKPSVSSLQLWDESLRNCCRVRIPYKRFQDLYEIAVRTLLLHSPVECFAGPYTYKRFWFRDAAFIVHALLCAGQVSKAERIINHFFTRQTSDGYFLSQEGEWDSNGEALWAMQRFCAMSGKSVPRAWKEAIEKGASWIIKKRNPVEMDTIYAGLFPAGFSAEHLGPNDFYYWDNFWGAAGLHCASWMLARLGEKNKAMIIGQEADSFLVSIDESLRKVAGPMRRPIMPASPFRRPDSGAVGSLAAGYPLQLWESDDERLYLTAEYLYENCLVDNAFYHDISHSGINPYLTLHIAEVLMRRGDVRFKNLMETIASLASPTGQWPEAMHPLLKTGCMGDGQHVWAAAEWIIMLRNCFIREEPSRKALVLCSGMHEEILSSVEDMEIGLALTLYGPISLTISVRNNHCTIRWQGAWYEGQEPSIEIAFPGQKTVSIEQGVTHYQCAPGGTSS